MKNVLLLEQAKELMRADYANVDLGSWGFCIAGYTCRAAGLRIIPVIDRQQRLKGYLTDEGPVPQTAGKLLGLNGIQEWGALFVAPAVGVGMVPTLKIGTPEYVAFVCRQIDVFVARHKEVLPDIPEHEPEPEPEYELAGMAA